MKRRKKEIEIPEIDQLERILFKKKEEIPDKISGDAPNEYSGEATDSKRNEPSLRQLEAETTRIQEKRLFISTLRSTISVLIVVAAVAVLVATLWMPVMEVYGTSMTPTLVNGEIVISIKGSDFKTGDIIAFYHGNKLLVKRCIAGPGDWVNIDEEGNVFVNGKLLDEPYITEKALGECNLKLPYQVPDERWFLIGDHRATSVDSRNTSVGCISQDQIVGKIVFRIWPFERFGRVS